MTGRLVAAVDLGASSGRVVVAEVGPDRLDMTEVARFENNPVSVHGVLQWDILAVFRGILAGLRASGSLGRVESIGVDSWGVDYGLLDADGRLLGNPVHYRDARTVGVAERLAATLAPPAIYAATGIAAQPFNTLYQLIAARDDAQLAAARTLLLIPDLITYWLTGNVGAEVTNASTTQMLAAGGEDWAKELLSDAGVRTDLLPSLWAPGAAAGALTDHAAAETGLPSGTKVTVVASHDTASAVVGVPAASERFGYVSCGTWSLVGLELDRPVLTEAARLATFTNEVGVDGTIRFLRNVMGLWLLQECLSDWRREGHRTELDALLDQASRCEPLRSVLDATDPRFLAPGGMVDRIVAACAERDEPAPRAPAEVVRCIIDSLALAHRRAIRTAQDLSGRLVDVVHIVGGGSRNELLCQLTADACGLPVEAGPVEATALGNVLVQARALRMIGPDLADMRSLLRQTQTIRRYEPGGNPAAWDQAEARTAR